MFTNKILLITGGTGTFGNAVLRKLLLTDVVEIRIFSRDEKKQDDMRKLYSNPKLKFYIGDVRNLDGIRDAMENVDFVFHAAALKQVPSCEFFPFEALLTNAIGTQNVLTQAVAAGVKRVVVLSTDKAVYPINAMGISKAMMEKIAIAKSRLAESRTTICITRYGNVMASRGSVIPLFISQAQQNKPITITDPAMTRFMMTTDDAVNLVVFAFGHGRPGDIFVQKSPAASIGTRHGEKLYETLLTREERVVAEDLGQYYRVPSDNRDLNYALYYSEGNSSVGAREDYTSHNTAQLSVPEMTDLLLKLDCVQEAVRGAPIAV